MERSRPEGPIHGIVEGPIHGVASLFPCCAAAADGQTLRAVAGALESFAITEGQVAAPTSSMYGGHSLSRSVRLSQLCISSSTSTVSRMVNSNCRDSKWPSK